MQLHIVVRCFASPRNDGDWIGRVRSAPRVSACAHRDAVSPVLKNAVGRLSQNSTILWLWITCVRRDDGISMSASAVTLYLAASKRWMVGGKLRRCHIATTMRGERLAVDALGGDQCQRGRVAGRCPCPYPRGSGARLLCSFAEILSLDARLCVSAACVHALAATAVSPLPLCGGPRRAKLALEVGERGSHGQSRCGHPPPCPSPTRGEGM